VTAWQTLGIERTGDIVTIRRAYARKLKAIDPEVDPAAFIALREARDMALGWAQLSAPNGEAEEEQEGAGDPRAFGTLVTDGPEDAALLGGDWQAPLLASLPFDEAGLIERGAPDPIETAALELQSILFSDEGPAPGEATRIEALTRFLLDDPDLHSIERAAAAAAWFAQEAAAAAPRSDPMLPLLVHYFQWDKRHRDWDLDPNIAFLLERWRAYLFREEVLHPAHPDRDAWRELSSPEPRLAWRRWVRRAGVKRLLTRIRRDYPAAEGLLDPCRVALWDEHFAPDTAKMLKRSAFFLWLLFLAFKIATIDYMSVGEPSPMTLAPGEVDGRIDRMVHALAPGHLTLAALESTDPALVNRLRARIRREKRFTSPSPETVEEIGAEIGSTYDRNLRSADYALQARYWQLRADELRWLASRNRGTCELPDRPGRDERRAPPPQLEARRAALVGEVLLHPAHRPEEANSSGRYSVPAWLIDDIAKRSGLSRDRLRAALKGQGSLQDRCSANIALIDAALAKGEKEAGAFVREMTKAL
jgi:hypothetical protein